MSTPSLTATSESKNKRSEVSFPWLGVSIAAATATVALVIPSAIYLRRKMIVKIPSHSVAPRRQAATITSLKTLPSVQAANLPVFPIPSGIEKPPLAEAEGTDNVNPVFEAIRALGTATLIVTATAFTGFWAVRTSMDVKNTEELVQSFTRNMRQMILTRMPIVSSRIHRVLEDNEIDDSTVDPASWNWEDAQQRMKDAYDNEGLTAWAEVAVKELQAEERVERIRRKELEDLLRRKD